MHNCKDNQQIVYHPEKSRILTAYSGEACFSIPTQEDAGFHPLFLMLELTAEAPRPKAPSFSYASRHESSTLRRASVISRDD